MTQSPLQLVKERFKDKAGLIAAVQGMLSDELWNGRRLNSDKGLDRVSNKKLLKLHSALTKVKGDFGSRAKLIDAIAAAQGRPKDADFKEGLGSHGTPRLLEIYLASKKRSK
jgi:hypothetical protein